MFVLCELDYQGEERTTLYRHERVIPSGAAEKMLKEIGRKRKVINRCNEWISSTSSNAQKEGLAASPNRLLGSTCCAKYRGGRTHISSTLVFSQGN